MPRTNRARLALAESHRESHGLRCCSGCGRPELPPTSDVPPSEVVKQGMVEWLRFAYEFDELEGHWTAVDFVDWMALNVGVQLRNGHS